MERAPLVRIWALGLLAMTAALAAFNCLMDPYLVLGIPRIESLNARKPAIYGQEALIKTYDVLRAQPRTLILGASRVDFGIDALHPGWPLAARPVYNLAVRGESPYMSYRYLQYVLSRQRLTRVVLALDFEYFLTDAEPRTSSDPAFERRLYVPDPARASLELGTQRLKDLLASALSIDSLGDSAATLLANFHSTSWNVVAGNVEPDRRAAAGVFGSQALFSWTDLYAIEHYREKRIDPQVMEDVREILNLCRSQGVETILFIDPTQADMLEIYDLLGYWNIYERWKQDLAALTATYRGSDSRPVPLWDFSAYDRYSTESVGTQQLAGRWFRESFHYTRALGGRVIQALFGSDNHRIGVLLTPQSVDAHLAIIRAQQRLYRTEHPADAQRIRDLYQVVIGRLTAAANP
jgi:hypothetical protein